ncbi:MAG: hypothetical protein ACREPR_18350 [Brasilonema sp.]
MIRSQLASNVWTRYLEWKNLQGSFQAGTYELSPTQPLSAMLW